MLCIKNLHKRFGNIHALDNVSLTVPRGTICGLVGSNGSGKSTLLRVIAGVMRADEGDVTLDGERIFENPALKQRILFVSDEPYAPQGATMRRMTAFYRSLYPTFDDARRAELQAQFRLDDDTPIRSMSRGKRRLAAVCLALSAKPQLLLMDETADGLDPVMRHTVKSVIASDVAARDSSAILVSHSLRELESLCDQLALLHDSHLILDRDVFDLKRAAYKIQVAFDHPFTKERFSGLSVVQYEQHASVATLILEGDRDVIETTVNAMEPVLFEMLPLTLEEIFLYELRSLDYDYTALLGGDDA